MKLNNSKIKAEIIKLHPEVEEKSTSYITLIYNQIKKSLINGELKPGEKLKIIKPLTWVKVYLKKNDICGVLCDRCYEGKNYIRDYKKFCLSIRK